MTRIPLYAAPALLAMLTATPAAPAQTWPFDAGPDPLTPGAALGLSSLNEEVAGAKGFVRTSPDGEGFVDGAGDPIRFWAVVGRIDTGAGEAFTDEQLDRHYAFLAKRGVNMKRLFAQMYDATEGATLEQVNDKQLGVLHRHVAAARRHGIYVTICPLWFYVDAPRSWDLGFAGKQPWGGIFIDPRVQAAYRGWARAFYTRVNPHTGLAIKDDPAVAILQVQNEDSLFFWTFQDLAAPWAAMLRRHFAGWAAGRHGSVDEALAAWDGAAVDGDDPAGGSLGLYPNWEFNAAQPGGKGRRLTDQVTCMAELQRRFYADTFRYLRDELGCRQLLNGTNWRTSSPATLDDLERWTNADGDVIALNRYTHGAHLGPHNQWRVDPGNRLAARSVLRHPTELPAAVKQVAGKPFILTETAWVFPERYQAEGPFLMAAVQSLNGVDFACWFDASTEQWTDVPLATWTQVDGQHPMFFWPGMVPQQVGQFPAYAVAFRRGYVAAAAEPLVREARRVEDMAARTAPVVAEKPGFDPVRDPGEFAADSPVKHELDPLVLVAGRVQASLGAPSAGTTVGDVDRYVDRAASRVTSTTGQMQWDFAAGVCAVRAPAFQGVAGFLRDGGGTFDLPDVRLTSDAEYATVTAVSLDGRPLSESAEVLVQLGSVVRPTGWTERPATFDVDGKPTRGTEVVTIGTGPWQVASVPGRVRVRNAALTTAAVLDENGYAVRETALSPAAGADAPGWVELELPQDAMYVVLR